MNRPLDPLALQPEGTAATPAGGPAAPLVSVIVRSMDRPTLADALAAVARQTWPALEVVLVNARGGAHRDAAVPGGRVPLRLVNAGGPPLPRARAANAGLDAAAGDWLLFLDDDDTIDPDHVARMMAALAAAPGRRVAYAGVRLVAADGRDAGVLDEPFDPLRLWLANFLPIHAVLFAREAAAGLRFDESLAVYEDWDFWRQLALRERFLHVAGASASYRLVGDSGLSDQADELLALQARQQFYAKWRESIDARTLERIAAAAEHARGRAKDAAAHADALARELQAAREQQAGLHGRLAAAEGARQAAERANERLAGEFGALAREHAERVAAIELERARAARWHDDLLAQIETGKAAYEALARHHEALVGSWSWRLTAPLRAVRPHLTRAALRARVAAVLWWAIRRVPVSNETRQRVKARLVVHPLGARLLRLLAAPPAGAPAPAASPPLDKEAVRAAAEAELGRFLEGDGRLRFAAPERPRVSVIVVLYNQAGLSLLCLRALAASRGVDFELIVADNASSDCVPQLLGRLDGARIVRHAENLGFLRAVNDAAAQARGEQLLLLNNDAVVEPDTLARAVARLDAEPGAGAVGGPILLWDGRLQEAGSIVWRDGSCLGYGRGDDPDAPPYRFVREVDYCSGALLMIRRALFEQLGRFDEAYAPAYYEESDFCARLWQAGHAVVCDPAVRVRHFEFASDSGSGRAIELQTAHRALFAQRHARWLASRPPPGALLEGRQRLRDGALRVLFVDDRVPFPALGQGYPRAQRFVQAIAGAGHFVTHLPLQFPDDPWPAIDGVLPERVEVMRGVGLGGFATFARERAGFYDAVVVSRPHNMQVLQALREREPACFERATVVYDAEALFSLREIAKARLRGEPADPARERRLVADEVALSAAADHVIAVSEAEAAHYRAARGEGGRGRVHVLGHALAPAAAAPGFDGRAGFLFVGGVPDADTPNGDSVLWFVREVWPAVLAALGADARLHVVGDVAAPELRALASDSVRFEGRADDLAPWFDRARVFVVPTRYAAGIPHKAHEAAAHGLPMVATPLIAGQLGWRDELLAAATASEFADACLRLHRDAALWQRLQAAALQAVARDCSPAAFDAAVHRLMASVSCDRAR